MIKHIIEENIELFNLLLSENQINADDVIAARNTIWADGRTVNHHVFFHLMRLALHNEAHHLRECSIYPIIAEHLNAKILGGPNQPDLLLNDTIPIEVKTKSFNKAALIQLQRYMQQYNATQGIAVAERIEVELPDNIEFIQIKFDNIQNKYSIVKEHI